MCVFWVFAQKQRAATFLYEPDSKEAWWWLSAHHIRLSCIPACALAARRSLLSQNTATGAPAANRRRPAATLTSRRRAGVCYPPRLGSTALRPAGPRCGGADSSAKPVHAPFLAAFFALAALTSSRVGARPSFAVSFSTVPIRRAAACSARQTGLARLPMGRVYGSSELRAPPASPRDE